MVKFGWDKLKRFLAQANSWTGQQTFSNINVTGGTISGVTFAENFTSATDPAANAAVSTTIVNTYNGTVVTLTAAGNTQTLQSPTTAATIRKFMVINNDTSNNNLSVVANSVTFVLTPGEGQCFLWDGSAWGPTDLGITSIPVPVTQGGTGASTLTDHGVLLGSGTAAITPMTALGAGELVVGVAGADPHALAAGATTKILVGGGAADPVWTEATGTGAPVRATSPTLVTPALGTPSSGVMTNTTSATAADNTSSTSLATTAFAKSQDAVLAREPDQGVAMTYAASGSTGITVADNDNIDFGTGNFTLVWKGSLPDWTPSTEQHLIYKYTPIIGYLLRIVDAANNYKVGCTVAGVTTYNTYLSSTAPSIADGTEHEIVAVVTVGTVNTAVDFYIDGSALGVQQTAANNGSINNSEPLYAAGNNAVRTAGTTHHAYTFNRALTAAEVLDLYRNGISEADKWGSQTAKMTDTASKDFTSGDATKSWNTSGSGLGLWNKRVRVQYEVTANTSNATSLTIEEDAYGPGGLFKASVTGQSVTVGVHSYEAVADYETGTGFRVDLTAVGISSGTLTIANVYIYEVGATLALEPANIQPVPGMWLDSSTNKLHAIYPAAGATITKPKDTFVVKWVNTWAGTHEAQYLGGVNQAMLPTNCYITSILGVVAGGTIEDIILGDGSDTDHWVAATSGLTAGTVNFTVANATSDGTNYKLVVDPDANFTGSITWTIRGYIYQ